MSKTCQIHPRRSQEFTDFAIGSHGTITSGVILVVFSISLHTLPRLMPNLSRGFLFLVLHVMRFLIPGFLWQKCIERQTIIGKRWNEDDG